MKIEKINDNQIRCTLSRQELEERKIRLSELAYGSEKARDLFQEMLKQANFEFGFEAEDMPIMIEAVPMAGESIVLVITKVEYPDELDTRFSRFSEMDEMLSNGEKEQPKPLEISRKGASDVLDLFRQMKEDTGKKEEQEPVLSVEADMVREFAFQTPEQLETLACVLEGLYRGANSLYRHGKKDELILLLHKSDHTPSEFNKICNLAAEYGQQKAYTPASAAYLEEHAKIVCRGNALQLLAKMED